MHHLIPRDAKVLRHAEHGLGRQHALLVEPVQQLLRGLRVQVDSAFVSAVLVVGVQARLRVFQMAAMVCRDRVRGR